MYMWERGRDTWSCEMCMCTCLWVEGKGYGGNWVYMGCMKVCKCKSEEAKNVEV